MFSLSQRPSTPLTPAHIRLRQRRSDVVGMGCVIFVTALGAALSVVTGNPIIGAIAAGALAGISAVLVWLWHRPVRGVYTLCAAAVLLATYVQSGLTDYIGHYLLFFQDIKTWSHVGIVVSTAEVFIVLTIAVWLLKGIAERNLRFERGSLMIPLGLYMLMVMVAEVHGLATGGSLRDSLWELRSQAYMFVAYLLVCNLVRTRSQITTLLWIVLVCAGLRGIEGSLQYILVLRPSGELTRELYPHEQSYFYNAFLTLTVLLLLVPGPPRMKRVALWLTPFVIVGELANNRRASIAALLIAMLVLCLILGVVRPKYRQRLGWILLFLAVVYPPYYLQYQNKNGLLALPARAISSNFQPTASDAQSNQYRVYENRDIKATVRASPIIGYGFGKPMLAPYPLPNILSIDPWQYLMPHNSILWVWMRTGTIGFFFLWFLLGTAIVQVTSLIRRERDRWLQGQAIFVLLMLIQQVIISYVDLQWSNYRTMIMTGIWFALISTISRLSSEAAGSGAGRPRPLSTGKSRRRGVVKIPQLAVVET